MFVEIHMLQNFAPSCLNRDDVNAPKDCEFGGYRRARISSQCLKRAVRKQFEKDNLISAENLAVRTRLVANKIAEKLKDYGKPESEALKVAENAINGLGLAVDKEKKTEYLIFLSNAEIEAIAKLCKDKWNELAAITPDAKAEDESSKKKRGKKSAIPDEIVKELKTIIKNGRAVDVALFGRMMADDKQFNVDAAAQVAHAISTHKVAMDMDFYTAVDDLQPVGDSGAGMMGTVEFNSSCFYRYAVIDTEQLSKNLKCGGHSNAPTVKDSVGAFIKASIMAIPTGKQNSMAAHNLPAYIQITVREGGQPISLANAFVRPVNISGYKDKNLMEESINRLVDHYEKHTVMYGKNGLKMLAVCELEDGKTPSNATKCKGVDEMISKVKGAID